MKQTLKDLFHTVFTHISEDAQPVAHTLPDKTIEWRVGDILHRKDGPAVEKPDGRLNEWWMGGVQVKSYAPISGGDWWKHKGRHLSLDEVFSLQILFHASSIPPGYKTARAHKFKMML